MWATSPARQETGPAFGVEFAHDVINQQHGRGAMDGAEIFGLSHFERNHQGALLAFAAELSGGTVVEREGEVVPVRADQGGAVAALAVGGLSELDHEIGFHGGMISQAEGFVLAGDSLVSLFGERAKFGDEFAAKADDFLAGAD